MTFLLYTNVISEVRKSRQRADPSVRQWLSGHTPSDLYLSAITVLEVELGIARLGRRDPDQHGRLQTWLDRDLLPTFAGRVLPVDVHVARTAARLHVPDPRPERDALIGATAIAHGFTLVTRNVADFEPMGIALINPWTTTRT